MVEVEGKWKKEKKKKWRKLVYWCAGVFFSLSFRVFISFLNWLGSSGIYIRVSDTLGACVRRTLHAVSVYLFMYICCFLETYLNRQANRGCGMWGRVNHIIMNSTRLLHKKKLICFEYIYSINYLNRRLYELPIKICNVLIFIHVISVDIQYLYKMFR